MNLFKSFHCNEFCFQHASALFHWEPFVPGPPLLLLTWPIALQTTIRALPRERLKTIATCQQNWTTLVPAWFQASFPLVHSSLDRWAVFFNWGNLITNWSQYLAIWLFAQGPTSSDNKFNCINYVVIKRPKVWRLLYGIRKRVKYHTTPKSWSLLLFSTNPNSRDQSCRYWMALIGTCFNSNYDYSLRGFLLLKKIASFQNREMLWQCKIRKVKKMTHLL
jgi:hypothetical protein